MGAAEQRELRRSSVQRDIYGKCFRLFYFYINCITHLVPESKNAQFMAGLHGAFGDNNAIDDAVRSVKAGEATFTRAKTVELLAQQLRPTTMCGASTLNIRDRHYCPGCDGGCIGQSGCNEWLK
jgi:hypothetical protein